jgi:predicted dehydrogenase
MNQSIHGIDAIQWIASAAMNLPDKKQNPVAEVFCFTARRGHDPKLIEVEDTAVAVLKFRDGSLGQLLGATSMWPGSLKRIQVAGRDGTAEVLEDELTTFRFRAEQPTDEEARKKFKATSHGGGAADPMAIDYSNHTRNIADFVGALDDARWPTIDGTEARKAVEIVEACYKSAQTGGLVRIGT